MEIRTIALDRVQIGPRLREVDPDWVEVISESMRERGQRTPIEVRAADGDGTYRLIAGGHRVVAAQRLGWAEITASVQQVNDLEARMAEIEENLIRHELTPLDRARFLAEHQAVWQALHPETKRGGKGRGRATGQLGQAGQAFFERFDEVIAAKIQASPRDIRRAVFRGQHIADDVRAAISGHPIARKGAELDALARLKPDEQRAVAKIILAGTAETVVAAQRVAKNLPLELPLDADQATLRKFASLWRKASAKGRRQILEMLAFEGETLPEVKR